MALVLTTPTNPGVASWEDATTLPVPATPYEVVTLNAEAYAIADGDSRIVVFQLTGSSSITLPSAPDNAGVTLTLVALNTGDASVQTDGSDALGPYGLALSLDAAASPRSLTLVSVPASDELGQDYWMLVASE
jgi:hypothetical protein